MRLRDDGHGMVPRIFEGRDQPFDFLRFFGIVVKSPDHGFRTMPLHCHQFRIREDTLREIGDLQRGTVTSKKLYDIRLGKYLMNSLGGRTAVRIYGL